MKINFALLMASTSLTGSVSAAELPTNYEDVELIQVIGKSVPRSEIAGSATRLNEEDLEKFQYSDVMRILRFVPGVNIQEEDGFGLRPNIGLRGTGVERSAKITLMEDGVLIAPAPYAASSAYYFPTAARMQAVEVRKGSSSIKFGPRTVGGAVNLVSREIPEDMGGFIDFKTGSYGERTWHGMVGGKANGFGAMLEVFDTENDGFKKLPSGDGTGYDIQDYMAKFSWDVNADNQILLKFGETDQISHETYLGLSRADFNDDPYQRYAASQKDKMDNKHKQLQFSWLANLGDVRLETTAYRNRFERDWFKIGGSITDENINILRGIEDSAVGALKVKHNARAYLSKGIQSAAKYEFTAGAVAHKVEASVRYHEDYEDRVQYSEFFTMSGGEMVFDRAGRRGSEGNRLAEADALAVMIQDTIKVGDWTVQPGVRHESIDLKRRDWAATDISRSQVPTKLKENSVSSFIPGVGVSYQVSDGFLLTGGVFKGFNPPAPGSSEGQAKSEKSTSLEAGFVVDREAFSAEVIGFFSDYSNILGTCMENNCNTAEIGDQFNGGAADIYGLEVATSYSVIVNQDWQMPLGLVYSYTHASFETAFSDGFWGDVVAGDFMPYTPKHQLTLHAGIEGEKLSVNLSVNMLSAARATAGQGTIPGDQRIDARTVVDVSTAYALTDSVELFMAVHNLFDREYIVARRPIGLRPGKPLSAQMGVKFRF